MPDSDEADKKVFYEEIGSNYRAFLNWREKIVGGYVTIVGLLGLGFYQTAGHCGSQSVLLSAAIVVSFVFGVLNVRNSKFIAGCVEAGKALEHEDGMYKTLDALPKRFWTHGLAFSFLQSMVVGGSSFRLLRDWPCWLQKENLCLFFITLVAAICLCNANHVIRLFKKN
jgi:hypothetical protein